MGITIHSVALFSTYPVGDQSDIENYQSDGKYSTILIFQPSEALPAKPVTRFFTQSDPRGVRHYTKPSHIKRGPCKPSAYVVYASLVTQNDQTNWQFFSICITIEKSPERSYELASPYIPNNFLHLSVFLLLSEWMEPNYGPYNIVSACIWSKEEYYRAYFFTWWHPKRSFFIWNYGTGVVDGIWTD